VAEIEGSARRVRSEEDVGQGNQGDQTDAALAVLLRRENREVQKKNKTSTDNTHLIGAFMMMTSSDRNSDGISISSMMSSIQICPDQGVFVQI
jgi:hypothetical protein